MASVVGAPAAPGVTEGGANTATAPGGRPVTDIVTTLLKGPPSGGTVNGMVINAPCSAVIGPVGPTTANPGPSVIMLTDEVEVAKVALPEYTAVIVKFPNGSVTVVNVATPPEFTVPMPSSVAPL